MTPERQKALERGEGCLLLEEMREGWHFCNEFDLDLVCDRRSCRWCGFTPALMPVPEEET